MPLTIYCRRLGSRLVPVNEAGEDELRRIPELKVVRVAIVQERSAKQNAFFWALCDKVAKAMQAAGADYATKDWVADQLRVATGHCYHAPLSRRVCRELGLEPGTRVPIPLSIDFEVMDHWAFCGFIDRVVAFTLSDLLPHLGTNAFTREVERILDDDARAAWVEHRRNGRRAVA